MILNGVKSLLCLSLLKTTKLNNLIASLKVQKEAKYYNIKETS